MTTARARGAEWLGQVPSYVWDGSSLPVPLEQIADSYCGLRVLDVPPARMSEAPGAPQGATLSGLLLIDDGEIWVNAAEAHQSPGRRRFTIAHELGHWVLHRGLHALFCRSHSIEEPRASDVEEQASAFGGALLLPPALVHEHYFRLRGDIGALGELFAASRVATERGVCEAVRRPLLRGLAGVELFFWDDAGYEAWREEHRTTGYVLNDDLGDLAAARLHTARCSYLDRPVRDGVPRTRSPKWCSEDRSALGALLPGARRCQRCLQ